MLPAQLGEPVPLGEYFFDPLEYRHPIVEPFRGHERSGLLTTPIWKYVQLTPLRGGEVRTALAFENGDPAVLEATVGRGHVILLATDASSTSVDAGDEPADTLVGAGGLAQFSAARAADAQVRGPRPHAAPQRARWAMRSRGTIPPGLADASVVVTDPVGRQSARAGGSRRQRQSLDVHRDDCMAVCTRWRSVARRVTCSAMRSTWTRARASWIDWMRICCRVRFSAARRTRLPAGARANAVELARSHFATCWRPCCCCCCARRFLPGSLGRSAAHASVVR